MFFIPLGCLHLSPGKRKCSTVELGMVLEHMRETNKSFTAVSEGNVRRFVEEIGLAREVETGLRRQETELRRQELVQGKGFNQ